MGPLSPARLRAVLLVLSGATAACGSEADLALGDAAASLGLSAQDGPLVAVSAGNGHSCALRDDGGVTCWGVDNYDQTMPPDARGFDEVTAGSRFSCAVKDGDVDCWGLNNLGQTNAPSVLLDGISSGDDHSCGITQLGNDGVKRPANDAAWYDYASPCTVFQDDDGGLYFWDAAGVRGGAACSDYAGDVVAPSRNAAAIGSCWVPIFAKSPSGSRIVVPITALAPGGAAAEVAFSSASCANNTGACTVRWQPRNASATANLGTGGAAWYTGATTVNVTKPAWADACPASGTTSDFTWSPPGTGSEDPSCTECDGSKAVWTMTRGANANVKWQYVDNPRAHPTVLVVHEGDMQSTTPVSAANQPDQQSTIASERWPMFTFAVLGNFQVANGTTMVIGVGTRTNGFPSLVVSGNLQMPTNSRLILASNFYVSGNINGPERLTSFAQEDHRAVCWGANHVGQSTPPSTLFTKVAAGGDHSCGVVRGTSALACWGANNFGQSTPPAGTFTDVATGGAHTCAVHTSGAVACWGYDAHGQSAPPSLVDAVAVAAGDGHSCALRSGGGVVCWGNAASNRLSAPAGAFMSLEAGAHHTCATRASGTVECWGNDAYGEADVPTEIFATIASGKRFACGLAPKTGAIACFGRNDVGQASPPSGAFRSITVGDAHGCALDGAGSATCWGSNAFGQLGAPAGAFTTLSAGGHHTCGVRTDGSLACWGYNSYGQVLAPAGAFVGVASGYDHSCALRGDGSVTCWGRNLSGKARAPAGAFVELKAGRHHNCALDAAGNATCWGMNNVGQTVPPAGVTFSRLTLGGEQTCGITDAGALLCWGQSEWGQSLVPDALGDVLDASAGDSHACALRNDGVALCWGYIARNL